MKKGPNLKRRRKAAPHKEKEYKPGLKDGQDGEEQVLGSSVRLKCGEHKGVMAER